MYTAFRAILNYTRLSYTAEKLYIMALTAIDSGFTRLGLALTRAEKITYVDQHLVANDAGYGRHSFGSSEYPENDCRGRGLLNLTHCTTYHKCGLAIGADIAAHPELLEIDIKIILETGLWFWKANSIGSIADNSGMAMDAKIRSVTSMINTGLKGLDERVEFAKEIPAFKSDLGSFSE